MKLPPRLFISILSLLTCAIPSFGQTPIEILPSGHIGIKASVNGIEGNFIFDTGGGITLLTKKFSDKVNNIKKQDGHFTSFRATGERIDVDLYNVQSISIGNWVSRQPTISIIDVELAGFDGLISLNLFEKQPFTLDLKKKEFFIETERSLTKRKGNKIKLQIQKDRDKSIDIFTYVVVNEKDTLQFCLDSGAGNNSFSINGRYMKSLGINASDTTKVKHFIKKSEFNNTIQTEYYNTNVNSLQLKDMPDIKIKDLKTRFTSDLIYDGIMSINWIGNIFTIDIDKATMIVGR